MMGSLATTAAVGIHDDASAGSHRVMRDLVQTDFGMCLLAILAAGWVLYALWRVVQSFDDVDGLGKSWRALATRAGQLGNGLVSLGLAWAAFEMLRGQHERGGGVRGWTQRLMHQPLGRWLTAATGAMIIGWGIWNLIRAWRGRMIDELDPRRLSTDWHQRLTTLGKIGETARGIVFGMTGLFVGRAAFHSDPGEARGVGGALRALALAPHGRIYLAAAGGGLIAYGAYQLAIARFRRIGRI